jgi:hypothetical protein
MPEKWKRLDANVKLSLTIPTKSHHSSQSSSSSSSSSTTTIEKLSNNRSFSTLNDCVFFLLQAPEEIWQFLDQGECLNALEVYLETKKVYEKHDQNVFSKMYPFIRSQWDCISNFEWRIPEYARKFLLVRGRSSSFYADKLCTILLMETIEIEKLFRMFLDSRNQWIWNELSFEDQEDKKENQEEDLKERQLLFIQKSILLTIRDVQDLFFFSTTTTTNSINSSNQKNPLLSILLKKNYSTNLEKDFKILISSGKCIQLMIEWLQEQQQKVSISYSIHTITYYFLKKKDIRLMFLLVKSLQKFQPFLN